MDPTLVCMCVCVFVCLFTKLVVGGIRFLREGAGWGRARSASSPSAQREFAERAARVLRARSASSPSAQREFSERAAILLNKAGRV
jgi:hypothetical protein